MLDESLAIETSHSDSALGCWTSSRWAPGGDESLFGVIEHIWDFEGALHFRREQIFPSGTLELVVQLDEPHRPVGGDPFPAICLDGLQTAPATIEAPRGLCRVLGIRLSPLGAFALFGTSLADVTERSIDLRAIVGRPASELAERLAASRHGCRRVATALGWLRAHFARARSVDPVVAAAYERIRSGDGRLAFAQLAELEGRSRSRFAQCFREQIGLGPKRYARVVRFHRALRLLGASDRGESLSAIALAAGFYDQAHLNAEFRAHAGLTPRRYREALRFPGGDHLAQTGTEDESGGSNFQEVEAGFG